MTRPSVSSVERRGTITTPSSRRRVDGVEDELCDDSCMKRLPKSGYDFHTGARAGEAAAVALLLNLGSSHACTCPLPDALAHSVAARRRTSRPRIRIVAWRIVLREPERADAGSARRWREERRRRDGRLRDGHGPRGVASRPASVASLKARAIAGASSARATAEFASTRRPPAPSPGPRPTGT